MKIIKAHTLFSINVPVTTPKPNLSFFEPASTETLYFNSEQEAQLYQEKFHPTLNLDKNVHIAIKDQNKEGNTHWVLIRNVESMHLSNHNQKINPHDYYKHSIYFGAADSLKQAIAENSDSVIVVKECNRFDRNDDSEMGGPSSTTIIYDCADTVDKDTRFLHVSKNGNWFIERGAEVSLVSMAELKNENDLKINRQRIAVLLEEQKSLIEQSKKKQRV